MVRFMASTSSVVRPRAGALAVLLAAFAMVILDTSIVSVALPTIQDDLGLGPSGLAWVINAYVVAFGGLLLFAGRVGDLIGRRRMFLAGLAVFTLASVACGLATDAGTLIGARFAQGAGAAMTSAVILGMIVSLFPDRPEQTRAIGAYAFVGAAGASVGYIAGGLLTDAVGWHSIFFVNVPIGLLAMAAGHRVLDRDAGLGLGRGADVPGAMLVVGALTIGVLAIVGIEEHGATSGRTLGLGATAVALLVAFVGREARAPAPLVPLSIFGVRALSTANLVQVPMIAGYFGQQFLVVLYLQRVLGFGAAEVGLGMLPIAIAIGAVSLGASAPLTARLGARRTLLAGLALAIVGLAGLARAPADGTYAIDILPALVVLGAGGGLSMPALTGIAMSGTRARDAGLASGVANTTQQLGAAVGLAVLAVVAAGRTDTALAAGVPSGAALTEGYALGFSVAAALVALAFALTVALVRTP